jgi:hypothetical protein
LRFPHSDSKAFHYLRKINGLYVSTRLLLIVTSFVLLLL